MLVLSRKPGDTIVIDGGITVVVLGCEKGSVRLGFSAPDAVTILRGEVLRQVAEENRRAVAPQHATRALVGLLAQAQA